MEEKLQQLQKIALEKIVSAQTDDVLESVHTQYLGRKQGELNSVLKSLKDLPVEEKKVIGPLANTIKNELQAAYETRKKAIARESVDFKAEWLDVTMPGKKTHVPGNLHPISQVQYEVEDLFTSMGFMILDGPELESDYYNFGSLNYTDDHPAREMQDTFFVSDNTVMRTQTSSVQVRSLEKYGAPMRGIVPGRVFRAEELDASHSHSFYQVEGIMVDKGITIAHLIGVMKTVLSHIFKKEVTVRLRPGYFPFVEPGFELDAQCMFCNGSGCTTCKHTGWIELIPCGMVHPNVLRAGGVDPEEYSGFAFGMGLDRLVMLRYGIHDIRHLLKGDKRFLEQF